VVLPLRQVHLGRDVAVAPAEGRVRSGEQGGRRRVVDVAASVRGAVAHDRVLVQIDLHHLVGDQVLPLGQRQHLLVDPHQEGHRRLQDVEQPGGSENCAENCAEMRPNCARACRMSSRRAGRIGM
jgi:hypothetical protein